LVFLAPSLVFLGPPGWEVLAPAPALPQPTALTDLALTTAQSGPVTLNEGRWVGSVGIEPTTKGL